MNSFALSVSALTLIAELFTESALVTGDTLNLDSTTPDSNIAINWGDSAGANLRALLDAMGGSTARGGQYKAILDKEIGLMNTFYNTNNSTTEYRFSGQLYAMQADILRKGDTLTGNLGNQSWATGIEAKWDDVIDQLGVSGARATHLKSLVDDIPTEINAQWNGGTVGALP